MKLYNLPLNQNKYPQISRWLKKPKYLVYVEDVTIASIQAIFGGKILKNFITSVVFKFFIINSKDSIDLLSASFYSKNSCDKLSIELLNSFDKSKQSWKKELKIVYHYKNFHKCELIFKQKFDIDFYVEKIGIRGKSLKELIELLQRDDIEFGGVVPLLVRTMANIGNFTHDFFVIKAKQHFRSKAIYNLNSMYITSIYNSSFLHANLPAFSIDNYYLVTPNNLYTNYEKLFFPFDFQTWILFLLTLVLTFGIILILNNMPGSIKSIVFGTKVNMPAYNALSIFFGIGQTKLPGENFSRFILLLFIFFCLIFRTCYQSKLFEFITTDMRQPMPETIDDIVRFNYKIIVCRGTSSNDILNLELINGRLSPEIIEINNAKMFTNLYSIALMKNSTEKLAFFTNEINHASFNATFQKSLTIMKKEHMIKMNGISINRFAPIAELLDSILERLFEAGILNHLYKFGIWFHYRPFDDEIKESLRIFSLSDLEFGFVLWLIACGVSLIAFIGEHLWRKFLRKMKIFAGLIYLMKLINERMKFYNDRW